MFSDTGSVPRYHYNVYQEEKEREREDAKRIGSSDPFDATYHQFPVVVVLVGSPGYDDGVATTTGSRLLGGC